MQALTQIENQMPNRIALSQTCWSDISPPGGGNGEGVTHPWDNQRLVALATPWQPLMCRCWSSAQWEF